MSYAPPIKGFLRQAHIDRFTTIVGASNVVWDDESLHKYGRDETEHLVYLPEVVVKPRTAEEISQIMAAL